ncbi:MAG: S41 family peptidase [Candidatus Marinimicrobia bacterium]|nr:S41 family peptidase [Candidatus Neomarinimicrobiota bacterium]
MKKIIRHIIPFIIVLLFMASCERLVFSPNPPADPRATFQYLWDKIDRQYAYFDVKNVDWDEIYLEYAPKMHADLSDDSLFTYLGSMMNELKDGHVNLFSEFNKSRYDIRRLGPNNIDFRFIQDNYLGADYYYTGPFIHDFIADDNIGYIRYSSFSSLFTDENMMFMFERYENTDGLIFDMRQNGGGYLMNVFKFLSYFTLTEEPVYTTCIKSGPDHEAFTESVAEYSTPYDTVIHYLKPIAVLIDRGSYSATSMFSLATLQLNNIFLVGDTTGGGLGMPNGGQLPNGWTYRFSITRTLTPDGLNYENGIPPDIYAVLDSSDMAQGYDTVIETALDSLLGR